MLKDKIEKNNIQLKKKYWIKKTQKKTKKTRANPHNLQFESWDNDNLIDNK
jgi:poly-D-alanine transfer protein DltD